MMRCVLSFILLMLSLQLSAQVLPCVGYEMRSDDQFFRGSGSAVDVDSLMAKRKALMVARQRIAQQIQTQVDNATELYMLSVATDESSSIREVLISTTRTVSRQMLIGCRPICSSVEVGENGQYTASVAVEVSVKLLTELLEIKSESGAVDWRRFRELMFKKLDQLQ